MDRNSNSPVLNSVSKRNSWPVENGNIPHDEKLNSHLDHSSNEKSDNEKCTTNSDFSHISEDAGPKSECESKATAISSFHIANDDSKISQGVLLNATRFVSNIGQEQNLSHFLEFGENTLKICEPKLEEKHEDVKEEPVKEMSLSRKIAFGISFLPSVIFVLCFAVILPCQPYDVSKSCYQRKWFAILNGTDVRMEELVNNQLLLGYKNNTAMNANGLLSLDIDSGEKQWQFDLEYEPKSIDCNVFDVNEDGSTDCIVVFKNGALSAFNLSDGHVFWKYRENEVDVASTPLILTQCPTSNGSKSMAIAKIDVDRSLYLMVMDLTDRSVLRVKKVPVKIGCLFPRLISWKNENVSDIILFCKSTNNTGFIELLSQEDWCSSDVGKYNDLTLRISISLDMQQSEALIFPTKEGILVFSGIVMTFFKPDATKLWEIDIDSQFSYRYPRYGRFNGNDQQIALVQDSVLNGSSVVIFNITDGNVLKSSVLPAGQIIDTTVLHGESADYILVSLLKLNSTEEGSVLKESVSFPANVTLGPNEKYVVSNEYNISKEKELTLQLILLHFNEKEFQSVLYSTTLELPYNDDESYISEVQRCKITVSPEDEAKSKKLNLVISETYMENINGEKLVFTKLHDMEFNDWETPEANNLCK